MSADLLEWADDIVVMESRHSRQIRNRFGDALKDKRLITLDIPDRYAFMQNELIAELQQKSYRWQSQKHQENS